MDLLSGLSLATVAATRELEDIARQLDSEVTDWGLAAVPGTSSLRNGELVAVDGNTGRVARI